MFQLQQPIRLFLVAQTADQRLYWREYSIVFSMIKSCSYTIHLLVVSLTYPSGVMHFPTFQFGLSEPNFPYIPFLSLLVP